MELQSAINLFPVFNSENYHPVTLSKILWVFYESNQKYFTIDQLKSKTDLEEKEIQEALEALNSLGDIATRHQHVDETFFVDVNGSIKNLKNGVSRSKNALILLETIVDSRDESNPTLNDFIKKIILIYSEVLDFMDEKVNEYFNTNN